MTASHDDISQEARRAAVGIVRTLRDHGHAAYLAGGCVRDELLGLRPTDYDVATDAEPGVITRLFERTSEVGVAFGVVLVHHARGRTTEVATFRRDFEYGDKRRPDRVEFATAEEDARRRDFTVNALFLDPLEGDEAGRVIDYVGGLEDLERGVIRAVGDPEERLDEDHLRALRAVRFACRLGFELDGGTAGAIRAHARELAGVSRERIGEELRKMLAHAARARAAGLLQELGLDAPTLNEGHADAEPRVLGGLPGGADFPTALAAWAIDRHGSGAELAVRGWRSALCLSNEERDALARTLETVRVLRGSWMSAGVASQKRVVNAPSFGPARLVLRSLDPGLEAAVSARLEGLERIGSGMRPEPLLSGDDLIAMGLRPGPDFARILHGVYDAQLEGRVSERGEAEALARELSGERGRL